MTLRLLLVGTVLTATLAAQGVISGSVTGPQGPVAGAIVRALDVATGAAREIEVSREGAYVLNLPAATLLSALESGSSSEWQ